MEADEIPVLLLGFNRPDKIAAMVAPLRQVRPKKVYLAVDGPRPGREAESDLCEQTQRAMEAAVDWPCEVKRLYRASNLGCRLAVSGAISWVFETEAHCVILEDDCQIEPDFFDFASSLLDRHENDLAVMSISAATFQKTPPAGAGDYYASKYSHCWGWATWKRAWQHYEDNLDALSGAISAVKSKALHSSADEALYWRMVYENCEAKRVDSWAYRWLFSCWNHGGVGLIPKVNLVTNLGFDEAGTHTTGGDSLLPPVGSLSSALPPATLEPHAEADAFTFRNVYCPAGSAVEREVLQRRIRELQEQTQLLKLENRQLSERLKQKPPASFWQRLLGRR